MISVLGLELNEAKEALETQGFSISLKEVRSKKGVEGDSYRIVRQKLISDTEVELCYSQVVTEIAEAK